jgi:mRNA-degrading endonuclease RelE of RelBE toxin-antitoxin system
MEQTPNSEEALADPFYRVFWYQKIKNDLRTIDPNLVEKIVSAAENRLYLAPASAGQPLKGTTKLLWKLRYSKYRIVYTINDQMQEVWVLSVRKRDVAYRDSSIESLLQVAIALQKR